MDELASAFIEAAVKGFATEGGKQLFVWVASLFRAAGQEQVLSQLQTNPTEAGKHAAQRQLVVEMRRDRNLEQEVQEVVTAELQRERQHPSIMRRIWAISAEETVFQRNNSCPIGGEFLWPWAVKYYDSTGSQLHGASIIGGTMPRSAVARCQQGHSWFVYDQ